MMMECVSTSRSASLAARFRARDFSNPRPTRMAAARESLRSPTAATASARGTARERPSRSSGAIRWRVAPAAPSVARRRRGDGRGGRRDEKRGAYVGDESETGEREIVVVDGEAVLLEEEERAARRLGWDTAMSRVTVLQLATCAATGVAEPLLGTIDAYWVASLGTTALAALGPNTCIYSSVIAVVAAHGFGTASTRLMAVALEKDERARREGTLKRGDPTLAGASIIAVVATAVSFGALCALGIAMFPEAVVRAVGVDASVVQAASGYMRVRAMGVPAVCLIAVLGGAFQAARDARTPLFAVLLAGTTNLILDPSLIFLFKMGFQGAAWATVVAQYAEASLMFWFAFRGPRRANFFGFGEDERARENEDAAVVDQLPPSAYDVDKQLSWKFIREAASMLGRVANVVGVWGVTSALAARVGVFQGAAHVLLFQIISIISIAAGALVTVANAVCSRMQVSEGDAAASGAGRALSVLGGVIFALVAAAFWAGRVPLLTNFTPDALVVREALRAYPIVMLCVLTYWYKALEGALIGRGDAKSVNAVFTVGGFVCAGTLAWFNAHGGLTIPRIWWSLLWYYTALALGMLIRWIQLDGGARAFGLRKRKTTPAAPIEEPPIDFSSTSGA